MGKIVAAMNLTLDGYADHTAMIADEELHDHYTRLLQHSDVLVYGRITYQLMENYWPDLLRNPSKDKSENDFAVAIDSIPKLVFSRTLKTLEWPSARLATKSLEDEIGELKSSVAGNILIGSPGLIAALTQVNLIDEFQLCVHPVISGKGLPLFKNISERKVLNFLKSKTFGPALSFNIISLRMNRLHCQF